MTNNSVGRRYIVCSHREEVDIALFRRVVIRENKLRWIQQFEDHVADNARF